MQPNSASYLYDCNGNHYVAIDDNVDVENQWI